MKKSHFYLLAVLIGIILFIWFLPPDKPSGSLKPLYKYAASDVREVEYKNKNQHYTIKSYTLPHWSEDTVYWKVKSIAKDKKKTNAHFIGSILFNNMASELASLKYFYTIKNNPKKHIEYGLKDCLVYIRLGVRDKIPPLCLGGTTYNEIKRYLWPQGSEHIYITTNYLFNQYKANIFSKINKRLFLPDKGTVGSFLIHLSHKITKQYPSLFKKNENTLNIIRNESSQRKSTWKLKNQVNAISKKVSNFHSFFTGLHLAFVAAGEPPSSLGEAAIKITFYPKGKEGSEKNSESYQLWSKPYPKNIRWVPHQVGKRKPKLYFIAVSKQHWGVYSADNFYKIKTKLQNIEEAIKESRKKQEKVENEQKNKKQVQDKLKIKKK